MGAIAGNAAFRAVIILALSLGLSSCGRIGGFFDSDNQSTQQGTTPTAQEERETTVWDLFRNADDPNTKLEVNKYIWNASLDILNFLPIQAADPFSGVIVTGFGTPPGGGRAYRATVYVRDPALDARSLNVALVSRSGPVPTETVRAVEDAILTRARQLRVQDLGL